MSEYCIIGVSRDGVHDHIAGPFLSREMAKDWLGKYAGQTSFRGWLWHIRELKPQTGNRSHEQ